MVHKLHVPTLYYLIGFDKGESMLGSSVERIDFATKGALISKIRNMKKDPHVTTVWVEKVSPKELFQTTSIVDAIRRDRYMFKHDSGNGSAYELGGAKMFPEVMPHIVRKIKV